MFAAATFVSLAYASLVGGPMDGTSWAVKVKPDTIFSLSHRGTLIFKKGRLSADGYIASGFSPAIYSAQPVQGDLDTVWSASLSDARNGVVSWNGFVRGDRIEGVAIWWTKDGKPKRFTFKGARKYA